MKKNIKYIGICGHRGAGKNTMAYLIANTIEYLLTTENCDDYKIRFQQWCDEMMDDEFVISSLSLKNVYLESFSDQLKLYISLLTGIPIDHMYNDRMKLNMVINLKDLSEHQIEEIDETKLITRTALFAQRNQSKITPILEDIYITLGDFILYFGYDVIQRFFGANFWTKSRKCSDQIWDPSWNNNIIYKIFTDVKTECERDYIKDHGGIIIKVDRPQHKKSPSPLSSSIDFEEDYTINSVEGLYDLYEVIYNLCKNIIHQLDN